MAVGVITHATVNTTISHVMAGATSRTFIQKNVTHHATIRKNVTPHAITQANATSHAITKKPAMILATAEKLAIGHAIRDVFGGILVADYVTRESTHAEKVCLGHF